VVRKKTVLGRFAFTLIELIFAIVIMSIAVMSLPMMIQTTAEGIEGNIVQEAIFAASAELMGATSYYWDLSSMQDANLSRLERVIDVGGNCDGDRLRPGHINQPYHRRCLDSNVTGVANIADATFPNLNNAVNAAIGDLFDPVAINAEASGYKQEYQSQVTIAPGADNNIKVLTASIYENDGTTLLTRLSIQSANIGEIDYYKRRF